MLRFIPNRIETWRVWAEQGDGRRLEEIGAMGKRAETGMQGETETRGRMKKVITRKMVEMRAKCVENKIR